MDNLTERQTLPAKDDEIKNGKLACIFMSIAVVALNWEPFGIGRLILRPLTYLYTFVHEMGHGVAAMMVGGTFDKFEMHLDGSGMATNFIPNSNFCNAFVAFGGLIAPAIWAAICLMLGKSAKASRIGFCVFAALMIPSLWLVIKGLSVFGIVFVVLLAASCVAIVKFSVVKDSSGKLVRERKLPQYTMLFIAITLCTNVFTRGDYLFTKVATGAIATPGQPLPPSDVGLIERSLFLPYWFWGGLIALLSVAVLGIGIWAFFKPSKSKQKAIEG